MRGNRGTRGSAHRLVKFPLCLCSAHEEMSSEKTLLARFRQEVGRVRALITCEQFCEASLLSQSLIKRIAAIDTLASEFPDQWEDINDRLQVLCLRALQASHARNETARSKLDSMLAVTRWGSFNKHVLAQCDAIEAESKLLRPASTVGANTTDVVQASASNGGQTSGCNQDSQTQVLSTDALFPSNDTSMLSLVSASNAIVPGARTAVLLPLEPLQHNLSNAETSRCDSIHAASRILQQAVSAFPASDQPVSIATAPIAAMPSAGASSASIAAAASNAPASASTRVRAPHTTELKSGSAQVAASSGVQRPSTRPHSQTPANTTNTSAPPAGHPPPAQPPLQEDSQQQASLAAASDVSMDDDWMNGHDEVLASVAWDGMHLDTALAELDTEAVSAESSAAGRPTDQSGPAAQVSMAQDQAESSGSGAAVPSGGPARTKPTPTATATAVVDADSDPESSTNQPTEAVAQSDVEHASPKNTPAMGRDQTTRRQTRASCKYWHLLPARLCDFAQLSTSTR